MEHLIMEYLQKGKENAISRPELARLSGLSDRVVRQAIEDARQDGHLIINRQDGSGYYIAEDIRDIARQFEQNKRRALSILAQQKFLRRRLKAAGVLEKDRVDYEKLNNIF